MANIVLDKRTRTPGGRYAFNILPNLARNKLLYNGTYSDIFDLGPDWEFLQIMLEVTATSVTDAGDVMDNTIQFSTDGINWFTVGMFTQQAGNGVAKTEVFTFVPALQIDPDAIFVMLGVSATVVDEKAFGRYMRVGIAITDADANAIHTFRVDGYIK